MKQLQRFNIALLPIDESFCADTIRYAQSEFADEADAYLLGESALPHVTLCQFLAEDEAAYTIFQTWGKKPNISLRLLNLQMRTGTNEKIWVEYGVELSQALCDMQRACYSHIQMQGGIALTPIEGYSPHITLARLKRVFPRELTVSQQIFSNIQCYPALGRCDENGVFVNIIAR